MRRFGFVVIAIGLVLSCSDSTEPEAPIVASIEVAPHRDTINAIGFTARFRATVRDGRGNTIDDGSVPVTWTSLDAAVASVDANGLITAVMAGSARIMASAGLHADTATVLVRQVIASATLFPDGWHSPVGDIATFVAVARDSNSTEAPGTTFTWTSSNHAVVDVSDSGTVTVIAPGVADIVAAAAGIADTTRVVVDTFSLLATVAAPGSYVEMGGRNYSGYFAGAASRDLSLVALTPFLLSPVLSHQLTFRNGSAETLASWNVVGSSPPDSFPPWYGAAAIAMTPDGSRTVVGSDDGHLYTYSGSSQHSAGIPVPGNGSVRVAAVTANGRFAAAAGERFLTLHDLEAPYPPSPIYIDTTLVATIALSANNRYLAYGGERLVVYDLVRRERIFEGVIKCVALAISADGSRIAVSTGERLAYFTREDTLAPWLMTWKVVGAGNRLAMSADGTRLVYGGGWNDVRYYAMGPVTLSLLWTRTWDDNTDTHYPNKGKVTSIAMRSDGDFVLVGTEGGAANGGWMFIYDRVGTQVFSHMSYGRQGPLNRELLNDVVFAAMSDDGGRAIYATQSGIAYFFSLPAAVALGTRRD